MSNKPAHKIRVGNLQVVIWRNTNNDKGTTWYSADPVRSYKNGDETWKETTSLGTDDILIMAELLRQAWAWIGRQQQADYDARKVREKAATGSDE
jgi:hypothetical protein